MRAARSACVESPRHSASSPEVSAWGPRALRCKSSAAVSSRGAASADRPQSSRRPSPAGWAAGSSAEPSTDRAPSGPSARHSSCWVRRTATSVSSFRRASAAPLGNGRSCLTHEPALAATDETRLCSSSVRPGVRQPRACAFSRAWAVSAWRSRRAQTFSRCELPSAAARTTESASSDDCSVLMRDVTCASSACTPSGLSSQRCSSPACRMTCSRPTHSRAARAAPSA